MMILNEGFDELVDIIDSFVFKMKNIEYKTTDQVKCLKIYADDDDDWCFTATFVHMVG